MSRLARRYLVHGRVQGVGFRAFVVRNVEGSGTTGWVRNVGRTTVEALACGSLEELATLEVVLRTGPVNARVDRVETDDVSDAQTYDGFTIVRSVKE
jgi:acylphosphatase